MERTFARVASALVALAMTTGLVIMTAPANAVHADRVGKARHSVLGKSVHNKRTHLTVTTIGTWKFYRKVNGKKMPFWSFKVSAQRQRKNGEFYGPVREGRIRPPHQKGKPVGHKKSASKASSKAAMSFCMPNTTVCADPWNWVAKNFPKPYTEVNKHITQPCVKGVLWGYGGVGTVNMASWILMKAGAIAKAAGEKAILGPEGAGVVALGGCFLGIAKNGTSKWQFIVDHLFYTK